MEYKYDIYLYGMVLMTTSHLLKTPFPQPDSYTEYTKRYRLPGGETGTCAAVLASLGSNMLMDGNHLGYETYPPLTKYFADKSVDMSNMTYDESYEGTEDYVFIDKVSRTSFGAFEAYFEEGQPKRWNTPNIEHIKSAKVAGIDPFFKDESIIAAIMCNELGKKYVTIDCKYHSEMHKLAEVNVVSNEFLSSNYSDVDFEKLFSLYANNTDGLTIFTFGSKELWYGRAGQAIKKFAPYSVKVESTLGAGDSFKAGAVYAISKDMSDDEIVSYASATAASACMHFPIQLDPPTLERIKKVQKG